MDRIKEILKYFNREAIYRQLEVGKKFLLPHKKELKFELNIGGGSFYDGKRIVLGLPEYMISKSYAEIFSSLKALLGHECEHGNSSDLKVIGEYIQEVQTELSDTGLNKDSISKISHYIANSVEDGRIEKRLVNRLRGYLKHVKYFRGMWWINQPVTGERELTEFLFAICTVATTGLYPKDWEKHYKGKTAEKHIENIRSLIIDGVNAVNQRECCDICKDIIITLKDYFVELLKDEKSVNDLGKLEINQDYDTSESTEDEVPQDNSASTHFKPEKNEEGNEDNEDNHSKGASGSDGDDENKNESDTASNSKSTDVPTTEDEDDSDKLNKSCGSDEEGEDSEDKDPKSSSSKGKEEGDKKSQDDANESVNEGEGEDLNKNSSKTSDSQKGNRAKDSNDISDNQAVEQELNKIREEAIKEAQDALNKAKEYDIMKKSGIEKQAEEGKYSVNERDLAEINANYPKSQIFPYDEVTFDKSNKAVALPSEVEREGKKLFLEIKEIFQNKKAWNSKHRKRGRIDTNALWQFGVKDYKIFEKKGVPEDTDYVFYVLLDGSGSMTSIVDGYITKWFYASKASAVIEKGISGIVPLKIVTFNCGSNRNMHYIVKAFDENPRMNKSWEFYHAYSPTNNNRDGHSIRVATKELIKRRERHKVLIVLSDGLPSMYSSDEHAIVDVRESVREARKNGIKVFSIAFGDEAHRRRSIEKYKAMYQQGIISCEPENITKELVRVFKKELIK